MKRKKKNRASFPYYSPISITHSPQNRLNVFKTFPFESFGWLRKRYGYLFFTQSYTVLKPLTEINKQT